MVFSYCNLRSYFGERQAKKVLGYLQKHLAKIRLKLITHRSLGSGCVGDAFAVAALLQLHTEQPKLFKHPQRINLKSSNDTEHHLSDERGIFFFLTLPCP